MFVIHPRTLEEMRMEIICDIERRIAQLTIRERLYEKSASGKAKIAYALQEFIQMKEMWVKVEIPSLTKAKPSRWPENKV